MNRGAHAAALRDTPGSRTGGGLSAAREQPAARSRTGQVKKGLIDLNTDGTEDVGFGVADALLESESQDPASPRSATADNSGRGTIAVHGRQKVRHLTRSGRVQSCA